MTLCIQAIHFLIAYSLLKKLLLRPVFSVIEQETGQTDALREAIESRTVIVEEKKRDCKERWERYQMEMRSQIPLLERHISVFRNISPAYIPISYSPEQIKTIAHKIALSLTEKVKHVIK